MCCENGTYSKIFIMFKKIKTFIKYLDLRWLHRSKSNHDFNGCAFVFIDNKFTNFFEQIEIFIKNGFLNKEKTVFIIKFYFSNYYLIEQAVKRIGIRVVYYKFYRQIPKLDGKVIYYPYNGQSNCRMILNRKACHVFLTHGESNKKASVNRMARLYDYVLAAGDISCQRYVENGIFTYQDMEDGRLVRVGNALTAPCFEYLKRDDGCPCLVYMPTWEGGLDEENYSSIAAPGIESALIRVMHGIKTSKILIKFHPNTGGRLKIYKQKILKLINELLHQDIEVYLDPASFNFVKSNKKIRAKVKIGDEGLKVVCGVVDVSASEFMLAAEKIPSIVFVAKKNNIFAPKEYLNIRKNSMVLLDGYIGLESAIDYALQQENTDKLFDLAFCCEEFFVNNKKIDFGEVLSSRFFRS